MNNICLNTGIKHVLGVFGSCGEEVEERKNGYFPMEAFFISPSVFSLSSYGKLEPEGTMSHAAVK